ncbi:MAG: PEP-CTERM sorting domain-containing protein [Betaproteobacteria bacterium]|nr:PEP-CTERM sorting domain-containing protein [Betaproteobacteria bacterium]
MKIFYNTLAALTLTCALTQQTSAAQILTNGGFESGFSGWARSDALGSDGTFFIQSGTSSPFNGDPVPAPPGGINAAMTDAGAGGAHVLWQDFIISGPASQILLSFDLFIGNRAGLFATPATLDWTLIGNQQVRVDILNASADPFSVVAGDVLMPLYQSQANDPLVSGYTNFSFDITSIVNANLGNNLRLRFAETDNFAPLQVGVDNVSIVTATTVPEPSSLLLFVSGCLLGLITLMRRRV